MFRTLPSPPRTTKYETKSQMQSTSSGWYLQEYDGILAGTIDGSGSFVNDRGTLKANSSHYFPPKPSLKITSNPLATIFVGRLSPETSEETIKEVFKEYGEIKKVTIARNFVTGHSRGYSFVEFVQEKDCTSAYENSGKLMIDGQLVIIDYERSRVMVGWKPRRLGGGFSGCKESGQLRFGARNRPFKFPRKVKDLIIPIEQYTADCWRNHLIPPKTKSSSRSLSNHRDRHYIKSDKRCEYSPYSDYKRTPVNTSLLDSEKRSLVFSDVKKSRERSVSYNKPDSHQDRKDYRFDTRHQRSHSKLTSSDFGSQRHHKSRDESRSRDHDRYRDESRDVRRSSYHSTDSRRSKYNDSSKYRK